MKLKKSIFYLHNKNLLSGTIDVSKGGVLGALLIMLFNSCESDKCQTPGFKGILEPDIDLLFGEITGRYLIATKNKAVVENYLRKNHLPYKILGKADDTGVLDFGFTRIRTSELNNIYQNSLERKA